MLALCALAWVGLLVAAPLLPTPAAFFLYGVGSLICHQRSERSFHLLGAQLPVCARCLGIYAGVALGLGGAWWIGRSSSVRHGLLMTPTTARMSLMVGVAPTIITLGLEWLGLWQPSHIVRALAGAPLGAAVGVMVANATATLHYGECTPRRSIGSSHPPTSI